MLVLTLSLLLTSASAFGQTGAAAQDTRVIPHGLEFSRDGKLLHVVGRTPGDGSPNQNVRAVTYVAKTGTVVHVVNLQPDTDVLSITSDGETAIVSTSASSEHPHLFLLDTETGRLQAIPDSWSQSDSDMEASISGDGHLISIYSESDSDTPMTVTVYDWRTKTLVVKRTSEYVSAGGSMDGGVTVDGAVAFEGNRVGSKIVDLKTGRVMAEFGPSTERSPNGAWAIQFPNQNWDESSSKDVLLKSGATGQTIAKLDIHVPDDELYGNLSGAFCGITGRFIVVSKSGIAAYVLPSGKLLATFPAQTWRDESSGDAAPSVACSPTGTRVAILDGARLTFHNLK